MNVFAFTGTLCKGHGGDPPVKSGDTTKGSLWASASLAVYSYFKKTSEFYNIACYGKLAEILLRANAGDQLSVAGRVESYPMQRGDVKWTGVKFVCEKITLARGSNLAYKPPDGVEDGKFQEPNKDAPTEDPDLPF